MIRFGILMAGLLAMTAASRAHFVFIVPEAKNPENAIVVFSDTLAPDDAVDIGKIEGIKIQARDAAGKDTAVSCVKMKDSLVVTTAKDTRCVFGSIDYGVMQKGDSKPYLLRYHAKSAQTPAAAARPVGEKLPLEIVAAIDSGKLRLRVIANGKPLAKAEVTIVAGTEKKQKLTTGDDGFTPVIEAKGLLGAWSRFVQPAKGEVGGKKYEEMRSYATLVFFLDAR